MLHLFGQRAEAVGKLSTEGVNLTLVLDVREPHEYQIVNLGAPLIPVGQLPNRLSEIPVSKDEEIVVHCKAGGRSQNASLALSVKGGGKLENFIGSQLVKLLIAEQRFTTTWITAT